MGSWCGCVCDAAKAAGDYIVDTVEDAVDSVVDAVEDAIETVGGWIESGAEWVAETAEDVAGFVVDVASKVWDWITETASAIWDFVKRVAGDVWEWTKGTLEKAWDWVCEASSTAWDWVCSTAEKIWDVMVFIAETIEEFVEERVVPFLLDVLWVITHFDDLLRGFWLGIKCLVAGMEEKEYDVIEGMFRLDEDLLENRRVAFLPIDGKYVIFSDLHLFVAGDPLDVFRQIGNHELYQLALVSYHTSGHTLVENGDIEDLWMKETTLSGIIMDEAFDVLGSPFGDLLEEDYEDYRIRNQAVRIFDNNADVYQIIRSLFHDAGRYVRILGNHDDAWGYGEYLPGLQIVYPGLQVYDYAFIGRYGSDIHKHNGQSPVIIIAHGHQLDAWNNSACREAGMAVTETVSGIPSLALGVVERSEWEAKLNGVGFDNELNESIADIDEVEFYENIMEDFGDEPYVPQFILGHTHHPLKGPLVPLSSYVVAGASRFREYVNSGTAGRWEQFIWCVTIENGEVSLYGWTWGPDGSPIVYKFESDSSGYLQGRQVG